MPEMTTEQAAGGAGLAPLDAIRFAWVDGGGRRIRHGVVFHAGAEAQARRLVSLLEIPVEIAPFSPAMAVHTGPGLVGACWLRPEGC